jgi:hypothetical protein
LLPVPDGHNTVIWPKSDFTGHGILLRFAHCVSLSNSGTSFGASSWKE